MLLFTLLSTPRAAEPSLAELVVEDARAILTTHCGSCHDPSSPTAQPRALSIYDLSQARWWGDMTDAQLRLSVSMLSERRTDVERRGPPPTDDEVSVYALFAEQAIREP